MTGDYIVADAQLGYPQNCVLIWLQHVPMSRLEIQSHPQMISLLIFSTHEDQKAAAQQSLDELMSALVLSIPDLAKHQPDQVFAGTYARKIKQNSWKGWPFTSLPDQLKIIEVTTEEGVSKHHHRHYTNYHFNATGKTINRDDAIAGAFGPIGWRYESFVADRAQPIEIPDDFLLWFDEDKEDLGDHDSWLVGKSLNLRGKALQKLYYQMKFELADVLYQQDLWYGLSANEPGGIFKPVAGARNALSGILMMQQPHRMTAAQIYWAGVKGLLPNHEWNGKWESMSRTQP